MSAIKKGNYVGRISYNNDIIFIVDKIIKTYNQETAILKGVTVRIKADSPVSDLIVINKKEVINKINELEKRIINENTNDNLDNRADKNIITGRILHLDGDRRYSEKSYKYYKKMGLEAIVKNIPEYRQPKVVYNLLNYYNPDILVITGHDGMIKKASGYNDIYNYRNSRHFINTVKEARRYEMEKNKNIVIFAGACQSYFEALISAGANFASSPARILIDFLDPLVIAKKVAITDNHEYIKIEDVENELRDGKKGINGIGAYGKKRRKF